MRHSDRPSPEVGLTLDDEDAAAATAAVALAQWHHRHEHCPRCGALTEITEAGWVALSERRQQPLPPD